MIDCDDHCIDYDDPVITTTMLLHAFADRYEVPVLTLLDELNETESYTTHSLPDDAANHICSTLFWDALESTTQIPGIRHLLEHHKGD